MKHNIIVYFIGSIILFVPACNQSSNQDAKHEHDEKMHVKDKNMQERHEERHEHDTKDMSNGQEDHSNHNRNKTTGSAKSPRKSAMANIGATHIHIDYSAPSKRGRQIYGGLVAYDEVWVTGAHKATSIEFYNDVIINNKKVEKGKYAFFTIPGKDDWIVILNKDYNQHLADNYDKSKDVLRWKTTPEKLSNPVEQLTFDVASEGTNKGKITFAWDTIRLSIPVKEAD